VREIVEQGVQGTVDLLNEFNRINESFAEPMTDDEMNKLIERQGEVQEKLDALNAWDLDSRLEMAMEALRCPLGDTSVDILSGAKSAGWRFAVCCSRNPISCSSTNRPTIWMPNLSHGSSITYSAIPAP